MSDNAAPLILLTRPRAASERAAAALRDRFGDAVTPVIAPLIEIFATTAAWDLSGVDGLIFTSEAGVATFAGVEARRDLLVWCVGDRTAAAAQAEGFSAMSANGAADDLLAMITKAASAGRLLHLHGVHTRGDLVPRLRAAGIDAVGLAIYDQVETPVPAALKAALSQSGPVIIPLFSPRTAALFAEAAGASPGARYIPVAFSDAVKDQLPDDWKSTCRVTSAPRMEAMLATIEGLISRPPWVEGPEPLV
ncbi:MAG: uroporphyrinogen-III synthase [Pseudomonadota bacterium]